MDFPYEKQCSVCGMIYEDHRPIEQEPFVCRYCRQQLKEKHHEKKKFDSRSGGPSPGH